MSHYEKEQERLMTLWDEEIDDDEEFVDSGYDEEVDHLSVHSYHSDLECDDNVTEDAGQRSTNAFYLCKDNKTKWNKHHANNKVRTRSKNIISQLPEPKSCAKNKKTALDRWLLFFDSMIIEIITNCTNNVIRQKATAYKEKYNCGETNIIEMKALFGILYLAGVYRSGHRQLRDLWRTNGTRIDIFRTVMAFNRFSFLLLYLRFHNVENIQARLQVDKLAAIRAVFDKFVSNCQEANTPGEYMTIDETLAHLISTIWKYM
ncbi:uncharacterized protein LOC130442896 [Diorhabda sublineata]|uniref:uncharacterized protein LOC130442896 n=1 Tax=Diorhabda sublineata TaxID=1163346 RepID=UPI0024E05B1C|nr:uncharacterized protein LOC130442896 [Diorhabda sublineata]